MWRRRYLAFAGTTLLGGFAGCGESRSDPGGGTGSGTSLALSAAAFDDGGTIPPRYTCDGGDVNPELTISGVVDEVETLALIVDDPDAASTFTGRCGTFRRAPRRSREASPNGRSPRSPRRRGRG